MSMSAYNPFGEMTSLRDAMNRLMEESIVRSPAGVSRTIPLDIYETADDLVVVASLPGVSPDSVTVTATGDTLTIKAKIPSETENKNSSQWTWYLHEIPHGEFSRTIDLPVEINPQQAHATFENGMLRMDLPKVEEARQHRLHIQSGGTQSVQQTVNVGQQGQQMGRGERPVTP